MKRARLAPPPHRRAGEINVTPLIDVVLVLLIIFMVVTPLLERRLIVQTPRTEAVAAEAMPEQLIVRLDARGQLHLNDELVVERALARAVRARLEGRADRSVFFQADDGAAWGQLAAALGEARAGGAVIGLAVEPPAPDGEAPAPGR